MTAGWIIVFSNGERKMVANDEAIYLLLRVYRAMTEEMTPASNVEEELSRVFFFRVGAHQPPLCDPQVNYGSHGNSSKERTHSISLLFIDYGTAALPRAAFV